MHKHAAARTGLILVDLLQQRFGVVGRVELHDLGGIAVVDLRDELGQLAAHRLVQLLQELQASALRKRFEKKKKKI